MKKLCFVFFLLFATTGLAQQRILISPHNVIVPLQKGESAESYVLKKNMRTISSTSGDCSNKFIFGYPTDLYVPNWINSYYHKDVAGQWYVAKAAGAIDTVFWYNNGETGALESLVYLRIFQSNIGPDFGPGIPPYPAPCQSWGYWLNTDDIDQGVAAFREDASDTTWYSTINELQNGRIVPKSGPPFENEKWGQGVGAAVTHRRGLNKMWLGINDLPCSLSVGEKFFISFKINSGPDHVISENEPNYTGLGLWSSDPLTTTDEDWPARNWKFYEHDSGPGNCAGTPKEEIKRGWVARGPFTDDTLSSAALSIWYSMTVTTNVPPQMKSIYKGYPGNTFETGPQTVRVDIKDCDPTNPGGAAVDHVILEWWKAEVHPSYTEYVRQSDIVVDYSGFGDVYECLIPGQPAGTAVQYRLAAWDNTGMRQYGVMQGYKVVTLKNNYYLVDTGYAFTHKNISTTGTSIDTSDFFLDPKFRGSNNAYRDDGTAGPFDLGGPFQFFGDTVRYAWVGINGAFALSKGITDTIDVNSSGAFGSYWSTPYPQHHYRIDTLHASYMAPNFLAVLHGDLVIADTNSTSPQFGHIRYGDGGDASQFIVEWDSIGYFDNDLGQPQPDVTTFRAILNRDDGTIEFQYKSCGSHGLDTTTFIGMQVDSTELTGGGVGYSVKEPGWIYVNHNAEPFETKPRDDWAVKFTPGAPIYAAEGWNLLSVSNDRHGDLAKTSVYPGAVSDAFIYTTTYEAAANLANGQGFWLKYPTSLYAGAPGTQITDLTIPVVIGWNMIGTISKPVPIGNIIQSTGGMVISDYFPYKGGYTLGITTLLPGYGYWVKVNTGGTLQLLPGEAAPKSTVRDFTQMNKVTIQERNGREQTLYLGEEGIVKAAGMYTGQMPPSAPDFDVRFKNTEGAIVTYPSQIDAKSRYEYPISITSGSYPMTVRWEIVKPADQKFALTMGGKIVTEMEGTGSVKIKSAAGLSVKLGAGMNIPKVFALGQNYPNPFNPLTKFTVDVPRLTNVDVVVYDLLGRKIRTLMSGEMSPDSYQMEWDGTDGQGATAPTGIYFIRMIADEFSAVQKVMLMK